MLLAEAEPTQEAEPLLEEVDESVPVAPFRSVKPWSFIIRFTRFR